MIGPKRVKLTTAETKRNYQIATDRNAGICELCHRAPGNRHHRQGRDPYNSVPSNILLACGSGTTGCHGLIHREVEWALERGYIVPDSWDPRVTPVLYWLPTALGARREAWVLLSDAGGVVEIPEREASRRIRDGRLYETSDDEQAVS